MDFTIFQSFFKDSAVNLGQTAGTKLLQKVKGMNRMNENNTFGNSYEPENPASSQNENPAENKAAPEPNTASSYTEASSSVNSSYPSSSYTSNGSNSANSSSASSSYTTGNSYTANPSSPSGNPSVNQNPYNNGKNPNSYTYSSYSAGNGSYYPPNSGYPYQTYNQQQKKVKQKKEKKPHPLLKKLGVAAAVAAVFGIVSGFCFQGIRQIAFTKDLDNQGGTAVITTVSKDKQVATYDVTEVVSNVMPAMVAIDVTVTQTVQNPFSLFGYGGSYEQEQKGSGTGFIIAKTENSLFIATNNHVVEGANDIIVTFCDDSSANASVKGTDEDSDLAVVEVPLENIDAETLDAVRIAVTGDSDKLQLGEPAIAIGNALGYGQSVTVGHISTLAKEVQLTDKTMKLIQTDAAINPGNSGGALINGNGEVIGINSVKYASTDVEGIGYAIPISDAVPIITALMNGTAVPASEKPYLGITGTDVTKQYQERFGLPAGVYVEVEDNTPAARGGLRDYDIITSFDGKEITTMEELTSALSNKKAGDTVKITVMRHDGNAYNPVEVTVTLDSVSNAPKDDEDDEPQQNGNGNGYYFDPFDFFD